LGDVYVETLSDHQDGEDVAV